MNRCWMIALVLASMANRSEAQEALELIDFLGLPIQVVQTPVLNAGLYEIDTHDLQSVGLSSSPDSVITIRDGAGVNARTLGGADECEVPGTTDVRRSCVRIELEAPTQLYVWVRARLVHLAGTADVRIQRLDSLEAETVPEVCPEWHTVGWCWKTLAEDITFGGRMIAGSELGANLEHGVRFETGEEPGAELAARPSEHVIMFGTDPYGPDSWWLRSNDWGGRTWKGAPGSSDREIAGTAEWSGIGSTVGLSDSNPDSAMIVVGPLGADAAGPYRFVRNDRVGFFEGTIWIARGIDADADGLGAELEAFIGTCDSASSPTANGFRCADLPGCDGSDGHLCKAASRDSDQDGLRDDHELFGVSLYDGARVSGMNLARYGTHPAHYDLLVEVDYSGTYVDSVGCRPIPGNIFRWKELESMVRIYAAINIDNRDGRRGIALHLDAGVPPRSRANYGMYGSWGGTDPFLCRPADAASPRPGEVAFADAIEPQRRWLFRHMESHQNGSGGAATPGVGGGAGSPDAFVHELGHSGGLTHAGPRSLPFHGLNGNMFYRSRINYGYQGWGGRFNDPDDDLTAVSFSDGSTTIRPFNQWDMDELCPFGPGADTSFIEGRFDIGEIGRQIEYRFNADTDCLEVDWNRDGSFSMAHVQARISRDEPHRRLRTYGLPEEDLLTGIGDLALAGNRVVMGTVPVFDGKQIPRIQITGRVNCGECEALVDNCWEKPEEDGGTLWLLDDRFQWIEDAHALALTGVEALSRDYLFWVVRRDDALVWGTTDAVTLAPHYGGEIPTAELSSLAVHERALALVRTDTDSFMLLFRDASGAIWTQRGTLYDAWNVGWGEPEVMKSGAGPVVADADTAVGGIRVRGRLGTALYLLAATGGSQVLHSYDVGTGLWTPETTLAGTMQGRPDLAQTSRPFGDRLIITWLSDTGHARFNESRPNDPVTFLSDPIKVTRYIDPSRPGLRQIFPIPIVWDDRPGVMAGLRAWHTETNCGTCGSETMCIDGYCSSSDGAISYGKQFMVPFHDGVFPLELRDYDDRPQLRHDYCGVLRECDAYYGGACQPSEWEELDLSGAPYARRLCSEVDYSGVTCTPLLPD